MFDSIIGKFQIKFKDRVAAANILANILKDAIKKEEKRSSSLLVLGIPRGGVIIADIIAMKLSCCFDIIIPRKLRMPGNDEVAVGAIMEDGTTYTNDSVITELGVSTDYLEKEKAVQIEEIKRRITLYRSNKEDVAENDNYAALFGKTIILVDDGAATGATLIAASRWIRKQVPKRLIMAVPVAPSNTVEVLKKEADGVEVITSIRSSSFHSVGQYYHEFRQVTDRQVLEIMQKRGTIPL